MPYILTRCITVTGTTIWMPRYNPIDPLDTGGFTSHVLPLSGGGVWDPAGNEPLQRGVRTLSRKGMLRESSKQAIEDAYNALAVGAGVKCAFWRQSESGNRADWCGGRLMVDAGDRDPVQLVRRDDGYWTLDVSLTLELHDPVWHGVRHGVFLAPLDTDIGLDASTTLDDVADTTTLTTSPQTVVVTNGGDMNCDDVDVALVVIGTPVTALSVQCGRAKWTVTGSIPVGNTLRVNTGGASVANETTLTGAVAAGVATLPVTNAAGLGWVAGSCVRLTLTDGTVHYGTIDHLTGTTSVVLTAGLPVDAASGAVVGAAAYPGFARDPIHSIAPWLRLVPGNSSVVVTRTGGAGSLLTLSYFDSWA